jgi:hypothetical protein
MKLSSPMFGALIALVSLTSAASAQDVELAAPIKECIDQNAPDVERAVTSLTDATLFLVEDLCADVIAAEQARESKIATQKMLSHYQQQCDALKPSKPTTSDPDEMGSNPCMMAKSMSDMYGASGWTIFSAIKQPLPLPTSYAAKLLLSLRIAHAKSNQ